jgi:lactate dehydrogenase-like 2-hydroxyacid dehydrogenase
MPAVTDVVNMSSVNVPGFAEKLNSRFSVRAALDCRVPHDAQNARALIPGNAKVDAVMLAKLPKLEIVSVLGVGYDQVDVTAAAERGIKVTNTPDVLTDDVADLAIALIVMVSRHLRSADHLIRAGGWKTKDPIFGGAMSGKTLGVLGLGRIGRAIAVRAQAMGMRIAYTNRHKVDAPYDFVPDLLTLATRSDIMVLSASAGPQTHHIVDRTVIDRLGPDGILINMARGSMVDEAALAEALMDGRLGGAGLDVFESEPHVTEALLGLQNVVLTPHIGSGTVETRIEMGDLVIANLTAHFEGRPLLSEVPESSAIREGSQ